VPSEQDQRDAAAYQFVAALGATMASANYPVTMIRDAMDATSRAYGLDVQLLALPNYVQVGSQTGDNLYIANPDPTCDMTSPSRWPSWWPERRLGRSRRKRAWPNSTEFATSRGDFRCGSPFSDTRCKAQGLQ
jgi:hypothetical protein